MSPEYRRLVITCALVVAVVAAYVLLASQDHQPAVIPDDPNQNEVCTLLRCEAENIAASAQGDRDRLLTQAAMHDRMAADVEQIMQTTPIAEQLPMASQLGMYRGLADGEREAAKQRAAMAREAQAVVNHAPLKLTPDKQGE